MNDFELTVSDLYSDEKAYKQWIHPGFETKADIIRSLKDGTSGPVKELLAPNIFFLQKRVNLLIK